MQEYEVLVVLRIEDKTIEKVDPGHKETQTGFTEIGGRREVKSMAKGVEWTTAELLGKQGCQEKPTKHASSALFRLAQMHVSVLCSPLPQAIEP